MDLEALRESLDDERFNELTQYISDLEGQRDTARKESINHRQSLKSKVSELEKENETLKRTQSELFERLGVESADQLSELDPKGQAEAAKQFEAKVKRLERELTERNEAYTALDAKHRKAIQDSAMRAAMQGHDWIDADLVASFVNTRLVWDDDAVRYKADDGLVMELPEAMQTLAKDKPHLLKTAGASGSGYREQRRETGANQPRELKRADFEKLSPADRMKHVKSGGAVIDG